MLKMLELDKNKAPSPKREDMVKMLLPAWRGIPNNFADVFKKRVDDVRVTKVEQNF